MPDLRYTLLADGSSDVALIPIINWLLIHRGVNSAIQGVPADLRRLRQPPRSLIERMHVAMDLYPCDLLFVHRDAEREPRELRVAEIAAAYAELSTRIGLPPVLCVIPVRMTEAWLLFDELAIRHAAGNRNGRLPLDLPALEQLELLPDPKQHLHGLLRSASGLSGRRLESFRANERATRVSHLIDDFSPLLRLDAFAALDADVRRLIQARSSTV
jgi:hypothetical protein